MNNYNPWPMYLDPESIKGYETPTDMPIHYDEHEFPATTRENEIESISVEEIDSVSAVLKYAAEGEKTVVLDFADFLEPGGECLIGTKTQEEMLCYESNLYFYLYNDLWYLQNRRRINRHLYDKTALYVNNVHFARANDIGGYTTKDCDVIVAAAPYWYAAKRYGVSRRLNDKTMKEYIKFVLDIAEEQQVDNLLLGAWGCGVFGQDPVLVANEFKRLLDSGNYHFKKVVFPIINKESNNYKVFKSIIG